MMTYSINIGTDTETNYYPLNSNLNDILDRLIDNTNNLIDPIDVRDAFLSLFDSNPFKIDNSYISVATNNPADSDIKKKIYIGKRNYKNTDVMTNSLLTNDSDIFFYNTKNDNISNITTKLSIITGINKNKVDIQSQYISGSTPSLSLDFINDNGDININNLRGFDGLTFSGLTPSNNDTIIWNSGNITFDQLENTIGSEFGSTGSQVNIKGDDVLVNGHSLYMSDVRYITNPIGSIKKGDVINGEFITDVLKKMIYGYIKPNCDITIDINASEVGTTPTPILNWTIYKGSNELLMTGLTNMTPNYYVALNDTRVYDINGTSAGQLIYPLSAGTHSFTITVNDSLNISSKKAYLHGVYPILHGFLIGTNITYNSISMLDKIVTNKSNNLINIYGSGNYLFMYDYDWGLLSNIKDDIGNDITSLFTYSSGTYSSSDGLWVNKRYNVYKWDNVNNDSPINYEFNF